MTTKQLNRLFAGYVLAGGKLKYRTLNIDGAANQAEIDAVLKVWKEKNGVINPVSFPSIEARNKFTTQTPPNLAVYDNGGKTLDRYTIVDLDTKEIQRSTGKTVYDFIGASHNPTFPTGFYQHGECTIGRHLGKKIAFSQLPEELQALILKEYENN